VIEDERTLTIRHVRKNVGSQLQRDAQHDPTAYLASIPGRQLGENREQGEAYAEAEYPEHIAISVSQMIANPGKESDLNDTVYDTPNTEDDSNGGR
jgi:hypothetical protein